MIRLGQLGEALRQPLLGAAVGGAGREHDERLIEIEADVAQQLPRPRAVGADRRVRAGPPAIPSAVVSAW